ncbi:MAG: hypothetical protein Rubg2KO_09780 [Rubricoccaceae bacterium]
MPQTLLAVLALIIAGALTLGQNKMMNDSVQNVMEDELEVIVSGTLLHTLEFADSRAFDDATTPTSLRAALGLNGVISEAALDTLSADDLRFIDAADFNPKSNFGRTPGGVAAQCDIADPSQSLLCDDISDLETEVEEGDDGWREVVFHTVGGDPLTVEVKVEVNYVEVAAPDVDVNYPTFHKRVDVYARSPLLQIQNPNHQGIHMNRVISYDPEVALEYLKRSLNADLDVVLNEAAMALSAAEEALRVATEASNIAQAQSDRANADLDEANSLLAGAQSELDALQEDVDAAESTLSDLSQNTGPSDSQLRQLERAVTQAQNKANNKQSNFENKRRSFLKKPWSNSRRKKMESAERSWHSALQALADAQSALASATSGTTTDPAALASATAALAAARTARDNAQSAVQAAIQARDEAQRIVNQANSALQAAVQTYQQAMADLAAAQEAYEAAQRRADYANGN